MNTMLYPCPCCGYLVFNEDPGSYDICPICFWEDDLSQLRFVTLSGANRPNLIEAQLNTVNFGIKVPGYKRRVESLTAYERDENWRLIDLTIDNLELSFVGNQGKTYPKDRTTLYYWRDTYWRRQP
jgi:hypothetical protein